MGDDSSNGSPLGAVSGVAGSDAAEAFELLGNETRLAILLALWEARDPVSGEGQLTFSDLYDRINYDHAGNFSYHLKQLVGQFVRKTDRGYELRRTGEKVVQAVISGSGFESTALEATQIDMPCVLCGAPTTVHYEDEWLYQVCTECEGFFPNRDTMPNGTLNELSLDPAYLQADRSPETLFTAAWVNALGHLYGMIHGVCPECSGAVDSNLSVCKDHDSTGVCDACERHFGVVAIYQCTSCKSHHTTLPHLVAAFHPAVIAFYHDHGVELGWNLLTFENVKQLLQCAMEHEVVRQSMDPVRIRVMVTRNGDQMAVTFDENVAVTDVDL